MVEQPWGGLIHNVFVYVLNNILVSDARPFSRPIHVLQTLRDSNALTVDSQLEIIRGNAIAHVLGDIQD